MVSLFGRKEATTEEQICLTSPLQQKALELYLYFGSDHMAYSMLRSRFHIPETRMPDIYHLRNAYGVLPEADFRLQPRPQELDYLYSQVLRGKTPQTRLEEITSDIKNAVVKQYATLLLLRHPRDGTYYIGRDSLRGTSGTENVPPRWTSPMTYSNQKESAKVSLIRVFQHEVVPFLTSRGLFHYQSPRAQELLSENMQPVFELYQFNTLIKAYEVVAPLSLLDDISRSTESSRLSDAGFVDISLLSKMNPLDERFRFGFLDTVKITRKLQSGEHPDGRFMSSLNQKIRGSQPLPYGYLPIPD